jgi:hypothetical protein
MNYFGRLMLFTALSALLVFAFYSTGHMPDWWPFVVGFWAGLSAAFSGESRNVG